MQPFVEKALKAYLDPQKAMQVFKTDILITWGFLKLCPKKRKDCFKN